MTTFETTTEINRPQQEIFDFIAVSSNVALVRSGAKFMVGEDSQFQREDPNCQHLSW
jgi:hypothetical protein